VSTIASTPDSNGLVENLPSLRECLTAAGIAADKGLGQHFLLDLNICRKIVRLAGDVREGLVIEVGPGPGGLTRALIEAGARVIVIEKDRRFIPLLEAIAVRSDERLMIVEGDALAVDEATLAEAAAPGQAVRLVCNLPYNVGTPLLVKWLTGPLRPKAMTLMFQKEVARRIVADAGDDDYGRLAVLAQALSVSRIVMDLPARAFTPPPKVDSAVVSITPLAEPPQPRIVAALQTLTQAAFGQRRKMLRSSLRIHGGAELCAAAGLDPNARAETIPVAGFIRLAEVWLAPRA
jgi:16S rRNA (adenine1518-N6/adenine1519-N6)-dimethyltransferase